MIRTVAMVGAQGTGKTSLCTRLTSRRFDAIYKETKHQTEFFVRAQSKGKDYLVCLQDTEPSEVLRTEMFNGKFWFEEGGDEDFSSRPKNLHDANPVSDPTEKKRDACVVVFSLDDANSFAEANEILSQLFLRMGFSLQGWKRAPIPVILVGNKSDAIADAREVSQEDINELIKSYTHDVIIDHHTKQPLRHIEYLEVSAKQGKKCDEIIDLVFDMLEKRPSRASVNAPDQLDGLWGNMVRRYEWARVVQQVSTDYSRRFGKQKKKVRKFMKPIFKMKWMPKMPKLPTIPVPPQLKVFPRKMWFCFCLRKDPGPDDAEEEEEEALVAEHVSSDESDDEESGSQASH